MGFNTSQPQQINLPEFLTNAKISKVDIANGQVALTLGSGRGRVIFSGHFQINVELGQGGTRPDVIDVEARHV